MGCSVTWDVEDGLRDLVVWGVARGTWWCGGGLRDPGCGVWGGGARLLEREPAVHRGAVWGQWCSSHGTLAHRVWGK